MKKSWIKRKTRLNPISKKQRERLKEYKVVREQYLEANPVCEVCKKNGATEIHHKIQGRGSNTCNTEIFTAICRSCHTYVHENPSWSRENGWLI